MKERIFAALLSALIYSFYMAVRSYTPVSERLPDTLYTPFWSSLYFFLLYLTPLYFLIGIPISFLIDKWIKSHSARFVVYIVSGAIVSLLLGQIMFGTLNGPIHPLVTLRTYSILGAIGALIFIFSIGFTRHFMKKSGMMKS